MGGGWAEVLKLGETSLIFVSWGNNLTSFTLLVASDSLLLLQEVLDVAALRQKVLQRVSKRRVVAIGVPVCAHKMLNFGYFWYYNVRNHPFFWGVVDNVDRIHPQTISFRTNLAYLYDFVCISI